MVMPYQAGIIISFFLFLLLLMKRSKSVAENILALWMLVMGIHQGWYYLDYSKTLFQYPHLLGLDFALPLLHGVLLFFYVSELTGQKKITARSAATHFVPFLLLTVLAIPFYALSGNEKIAVFKNNGAGYEWYSAVQIALILLSGLSYVVLSLGLIRKSRAQLENIFSNTSHKKLQWLEYLTTGLAVIWVLVLFFDDRIIFSGVAVLVLLIGIFGINQLPIFSAGLSNDLIQVNPESAETNPARYAKSGLNAEDADLLYHRLTLKMNHEALYKNNELTLPELAARLDVHPNYLSQVVNEKEGKNFYSYINTLRAEEFIRLVALPEKRHFSLLALANECGFNSKSTFNKYVKSASGKTPSEHFDFTKY